MNNVTTVNTLIAANDAVALANMHHMTFKKQVKSSVKANKVLSFLAEHNVDVPSWMDEYTNTLEAEDSSHRGELVPAGNGKHLFDASCFIEKRPELETQEGKEKLKLTQMQLFDRLVNAVPMKPVLQELAQTNQIFDALRGAWQWKQDLVTHAIQRGAWMDMKMGKQGFLEDALQQAHEIYESKFIIAFGYLKGIARTSWDTPHFYEIVVEAGVDALDFILSGRQVPVMENTTMRKAVDTVGEVLEYAYTQEPFAGLSYLAAQALRHEWDRLRQEFEVPAEYQDLIFKPVEPQQRKDFGNEWADRIEKRQAILKGKAAHPIAVLAAFSWAKRTIAKDLLFSLRRGSRALEYVERQLERTRALAGISDSYGSMAGDDRSETAQAYTGGFNPYEGFEQEMMVINGEQTLMPANDWGNRLRFVSDTELYDIRQNLAEALECIQDQATAAVEYLESTMAMFVKARGWECLPFVWEYDEQGVPFIFDANEAAEFWKEQSQRYQVVTSLRLIDMYVRD